MHRGRRGAAPSQSVLSAALTLRYRTKIGGFAWISRVTYLAGDVWELVLPAVFKTVCGALLRRPGWVRFPSIPATSLAACRWEVSPRADAASSGLRSARLDSVREAEPAQEALLTRERDA